MPELPEVETVRAGLDKWVSGRVITRVEVNHPRAVRRHLAGPADFVTRLTGRRLGPARRRGKYLWFPLEGDDASSALLGHLGMSGQLLVQPATAPDERHLHVRVEFADDGPQLRFVDQRTFGGLLVDDLVPAEDQPGDTVPRLIAHIARDPIDPEFSDAGFVNALRAKHTEVKRALLDQTLISGVGNIYADEALWRGGLHGTRATDALTRPAATRLLGYVREVLGEAIVQGGTSFDALYVNVNGESGYFDRSLNAYGREGEPCPRCGTPIRRESFMNRSSFSCPKCQPAPRLG